MNLVVRKLGMQFVGVMEKEWELDNLWCGVNGGAIEKLVLQIFVEYLRAAGDKYLALGFWV